METGKLECFFFIFKKKQLEEFERSTKVDMCKTYLFPAYSSNNESAVFKDCYGEYLIFCISIK